MKLRTLCLAPFVLALLIALSLYAGACEAWKKRRLGDRYEGPLEE